MPGGREENGPVGPGNNVTVTLETGHGAVDRDMRDAEPAGEIDHAGLALRSGKVGNGLDVVLGDLGRMLAPRQLQALGLQRRRTHGFPGVAGGLFHEPGNPSKDWVDKSSGQYVVETTTCIYIYLRLGRD